ncbi:MAG: SLBB domain-containing protein [Gammaproteobacteria bacterium]
MTRVRYLALTLLLLMSAVMSGQAFAQSPTAAQMELFRQLPPAEQERLMREYGVQRPAQRADRSQQVPGSRASGSGQDRNGQQLDGREPRERFEREPIIDEATGLPLFGYDLFSDVPSTFAPVTDIPVPVDYVLGPGDVVNVQLFGNETGTYELVVNRDGNITFPRLGPVSVTGLTFQEVRELIRERVSQQMIGVNASVTLGELRSIRVFVMGEAARPGSYTVSSLSTITNALFASGGIKPIGSLRNIQLKRNGELVTTLDLYDLLLRGDTRADVRLSPGDVIFIPPVNPQVGVDGEVRRPGVYELKGPASAGDLVSLAGGLTASAYPQGASLSRISDDQDRIVKDLNLKSADGRALRVRGGDLLNVPAVLDRVDNSVELVGHVYRPTKVQHRPGMRISDLIPSLDRLKPLADANYILVRRELSPSRRIVAVSADLEQALRAPGSEADIELQPRDKVTVFNRVPILQPEGLKPGMSGRPGDSAAEDRRVALPESLLVPSPDSGRVAGTGAVLAPGEGMETQLAGERTETRPAGERWILSGDEGWKLLPEEREILDEADEAERQAQFKARLDSDRQLVVEKLLNELRVQANYDTHAPVVRIDGRVRAPGLYPLEPEMRVSDLLRAGGSLAESAYIIQAEVTRYEVVNGDYREADLVPIDLAAVRAGDASADLLLRPYDFLNIKEVTNWSEQESVTFKGEVRFPGTYPIRKGETLLSVLERAGGLTDRAFVNGAVFTRVELRQREAQQLRELSRRLEADLAALALEGAQAGSNTQSAQALATGQGLLGQLGTATPVGRLAMDFARVIKQKPGSPEDILLEDGDVLMVPGPMQTVTVLGEVQSATSLLFDASLGRDDYINLSGGTTRRADESRIYIVRANGQITAGGSRRWFRSSDAQVRPGDTIVVPTDIERMRPLPLWSAVTGIIFNLAVAVAAVNSF